MLIKAILKLREPKKHSVRYDAVDDDQALSSLYVNKSALTKDANGAYPLMIYVTISYVPPS
jgi:hypothetical protein